MRNKPDVQWVLERTDEFQLLKLERKPCGGGVTDTLYFMLLSSSHMTTFYVHPIDIQGNQKVEVQEFVRFQRHGD
jgi:hypothetical protein